MFLRITGWYAEVLFIETFSCSGTVRDNHIQTEEGNPFMEVMQDDFFMGLICELASVFVEKEGLWGIRSLFIPCHKLLTWGRGRVALVLSPTTCHPTQLSQHGGQCKLHE